MKFVRKNWFSVLCIALGCAIIIAGGIFFFGNRFSVENAAAKSQMALEKVSQMLPQITDRIPEERGINLMPSKQVEGLNITAILEVPGYARRLIVLSNWDASLVNAVPCKFHGSIYDRSVVIGAGEKQFDFADRLEVGEKIILTDMEGGRYTYRVTAIQHSQHASLEKLQSGDHDLTVFVKVGEQYLLIRCNAGI